jgi:hypothetical protein
MTTCPKYALFFGQGQVFALRWLKRSWRRPAPQITFGILTIERVALHCVHGVLQPVKIQKVYFHFMSHPIRPPLALRVGASSV